MLKTMRALDRKVHRGRWPRVETRVLHTNTGTGPTIIHQKRESWTRYVLQLNTNTPINHVWNRVRILSGRNVCPSKQYLNGKDGAPITDPKDIANEHATAFTDNYSARFQTIKAQDERARIDSTWTWWDPQQPVETPPRGHIKDPQRDPEHHLVISPSVEGSNGGPNPQTKRGPR